MMKIRIRYKDLTSIILAFCFLVISPIPGFSEASKITITDLAGREVSLQVPVKSIILAGWSGSGNPFYTLFGVLGDKAPEMIIGMDKGLEKNRQWIWQKFTEKYPKLKSIPDVGTPPEINIEKIISLGPDVVMVPAYAAKSSMDIFNKIEQAGIPVVMNDFHTESYENHIRSIKLIGRIVGKPERAKEMCDFYKKQCSLVDQRLTNSSLPKPNVYLELGINSKEQGNTYGNKMWGILISRAGGINIAKDLIDGYGPISKETVLKSDPDIIILTGANWPKRQNSLHLGYFVEKKQSLNTLEQFLHRPGWSELKAVQQKKLFGIHHGLSREVWDFYPIQCFAKWFYPELFSDLDPNSALREFHRKFLGIDLSGIWSVAVDQ